MCFPGWPARGPGAADCLPPDHRHSRRLRSSSTRLAAPLSAAEGIAEKSLRKLLKEGVNAITSATLGSSAFSNRSLYSTDSQALS